MRNYGKIDALPLHSELPSQPFTLSSFQPIPPLKDEDFAAILSEKKFHIFVYGSEIECKETLTKMFHDCKVDGRLKKIGAFDFYQTKIDLLKLMSESVKIHLYYSGHGAFSNSALNPLMLPIIQARKDGNWHYTEFLNEFSYYRPLSLLCESCNGDNNNVNSMNHTIKDNFDWTLGHCDFNYMFLSSIPSQTSSFRRNHFTPFHTSYSRHPQNAQELQLYLKQNETKGCAIPRCLIYAYDARDQKERWRYLLTGGTVIVQKPAKPATVFKTIAQVFVPYTLP